jgi:hypothetical protein
MNRLCIAMLAGVIGLVSATAGAQTNVRVRGTITAFDGKMLSVTSRDGKVVNVEIGEKTPIVATRPLKLAEIKPGDGVGLGAKKQPDGTFIALQVQRFPAERGIPNEGHRSWDLPESTMTNAMVAAVVQAAAGHELTLQYKGGSQKVLVPETAAIFTSVPADRSHLVPGETVFITARAGTDGRMTVQRVMVSMGGVKLPQ